MLRVASDAIGRDHADFPAIYLRDNCPASWHRSTLQRTIPIWELPRDLRIVKASVSQNKDVCIYWSDRPDPSIFSLDFLRDHKLDEESRIRRTHASVRELETWTSSTFGEEGKLPSFDYDRLIAPGPGGDRYLLELLNCVLTKGIVRLTNCGTEADVCERFISRIGFARETNYGKYFDVIVQPNPVNQAFTASALPLHTDLPFYSLPPGVQMLHCINAGGENNAKSLFVDGTCMCALISNTI